MKSGVALESVSPAHPRLTFGSARVRRSETLTPGAAGTPIGCMRKISMASTQLPEELVSEPCQNEDNLLVWFFFGQECIMDKEICNINSEIIKQKGVSSQLFPIDMEM